MNAYKTFSLVLAVIFAIVGLTFLAAPARVIEMFNPLSSSLGLAAAPATGFNFYLALAVAYMYLVTVVAVLMYLHPSSATYPLVLFHGKIASAAVSFLLFFAHMPYFLYLGNGIVDGGIGIAALIVFLKKKRAGR
jgi:hypothetical protein